MPAAITLLGQKRDIPHHLLSKLLLRTIRHLSIQPKVDYFDLVIFICRYCQAR